jgi:hypothetical protein
MDLYSFSFGHEAMLAVSLSFVLNSALPEIFLSVTNLPRRKLGLSSSHSVSDFATRFTRIESKQLHFR